MANKTLLLAGGDGTTIATGYVGEVVPFTNRVVSAPTTGYGVNTTALATLSAGTWLIFMAGYTTGTTSTTSVTPYIATNLNADGTGILCNCIRSAANGINISFEQYATLNTTGTLLYGKGQATGATINLNISGFAVRIA